MIPETGFMREIKD